MTKPPIYDGTNEDECEHYDNVIMDKAVRRKPKLINYDFNIDTLITVEAPVGTDPDTLIEKAIMKLAERDDFSDITLSFDQCFDADTGNYTEDWKDGFNEGT